MRGRYARPVFLSLGDLAVLFAIQSPVADHMDDFSGVYPIDVVLNSDPVEARKIQDHIERLLVECNYDHHEIFGIKLALEEAVVNAIKHGNRFDTSKKVRIACSVSTERIDLLINDEGTGFDPGGLPDPTAPENLDRPCGRGVMLMRHYMTDVRFNERGNSVTMSKIRNGRPIE
jgi:serine/threonine-protein kinase RsbW